MNISKFKGKNENINETNNDSEKYENGVINPNENKNLHLYKKILNKENIYATKSFSLNDYDNLNKKVECNKKKNSYEEENKIICNNQKSFLNNKSDEPLNMHEHKKDEIIINEDVKPNTENISIFIKDKNLNTSENMEIENKKMLKKKKDQKAKNEEKYSIENMHIERNEINKNNIYNIEKLKTERLNKEVKTYSTLNDENKNILKQRQEENLKELKDDRIIKKNKKDNYNLIKTLSNTKSILMHNNKYIMNNLDSKMDGKGSLYENLNMDENCFFLKHDNVLDKGKHFRGEKILSHNFNENDFLVNYSDLYNLNINKNPSLLFIINGISETIRNIMQVDKSNNKNKMKLIEIVENVNLLMQSYYNIIVKCDINLSFTIKKIRNLYKSYKEVDILLKNIKNNKILCEKYEEAQRDDKNNTVNCSSTIDNNNSVEGKIFINYSCDNNIHSNNIIQKENNLDNNVNIIEDNIIKYENIVNNNNNNTIEKKRENFHVKIMENGTIKNKNINNIDNTIITKKSNSNIENKDFSMNILNDNKNLSTVLDEQLVKNEEKNKNENTAQMCYILNPDKNNITNASEKCINNLNKNSEKLQNDLNKNYINNNNGFKNFLSIESKSTALSNQEENSLQLKNKNEKIATRKKKKKILKELEKLNSRFFFIFNHKGVIINYLLKEINECLIDFDKTYQLYISN
ncbi:conserved Plasmodium protein, unknown function [Plasmodium relictum]|uniref:Uncharacterized protein n=1 Tax=Plasmodium relictum TaxID=85471 RepID=A0A1J1H631_PLARL|nr:conserved Plasmodium protein, unknown function [Plasmodium relictum]CRG99058.1 conserved Plasmodium protein, unknown function [Plasmodium relictum]